MCQNQFLIRRLDTCNRTSLGYLSSLPFKFHLLFPLWKREKGKIHLNFIPFIKVFVSSYHGIRFYFFSFLFYYLIFVLLCYFSYVHNADIFFYIKHLLMKFQFWNFCYCNFIKFQMSHISYFPVHRNTFSLYLYLHICI